MFVLLVLPILLAILVSRLAVLILLQLAHLSVTALLVTGHLFMENVLSVPLDLISLTLSAICVNAVISAQTV